MHLLQGQVRLLGDLLERRLATEHGPQRALGAVHLLQPLDDVHRHPDRACLVRERPRDRLPDPPGRVGRELEAPAPVELLDGPDQAERALLDQVEEGKPLVAVVLRDRDHEPEVGLDHRLLRDEVAALDPLRERHLLRRRQQRVAPGLAQEQLQRVGRRLGGRDGEWGRLGRARRVDHLDSPLVELAQERVVLERRELVGLDELGELLQPDRAGVLARLEERFERRPAPSRVSMSIVVIAGVARRLATLSHCGRVLVQPSKA